MAQHDMALKLTLKKLAHSINKKVLFPPRLFDNIANTIPAASKYQALFC
jgi:hypothetical protein